MVQVPPKVWGLSGLVLSEVEVAEDRESRRQGVCRIWGIFARERQVEGSFSEI